jgi:hypothetical protein
MICTHLHQTTTKNTKYLLTGNMTRVSMSKKWKHWKLSRRYKANSLKSRKRKKIVLPANVFYIDQILCDDETEDDEVIYLVRWEGHELPTWEPATEIPASVRITYYKQGRVSWESYDELCKYLGM